MKGRHFETLVDRTMNWKAGVTTRWKILSGKTWLVSIMILQARTQMKENRNVVELSNPLAVESVITCDRDCEMMHVLSDNSNKTEASENSPTTILGDENDSTSSNESDCHDLFFNLPCSLINSTSESENDKNMSDIDVHASQTKIPLY